jgi:hypothetical protein
MQGVCKKKKKKFGYRQHLAYNLRTLWIAVIVLSRFRVTLTLVYCCKYNRQVLIILFTTLLDKYVLMCMPCSKIHLSVNPCLILSVTVLTHLLNFLVLIKAKMFFVYIYIYMYIIFKQSQT